MVDWITVAMKYMAFFCIVKSVRENGKVFGDRYSQSGLSTDRLDFCIHLVKQSVYANGSIFPNRYPFFFFFLDRLPNDKRIPHLVTP